MNENKFISLTKSAATLFWILILSHSVLGLYIKKKKSVLVASQRLEFQQPISSSVHIYSLEIGNKKSCFILLGYTAVEIKRNIQLPSLQTTIQTIVDTNTNDLGVRMTKTQPRVFSCFWHYLTLLAMAADLQGTVPEIPFVFLFRFWFPGSIFFLPLFHAKFHYLPNTLQLTMTFIFK